MQVYVFDNLGKSTVRLSRNRYEMFELCFWPETFNESVARHRGTVQVSNPRLLGDKSNTIAFWLKGYALSQVASAHDQLEA